MLAWAGREARQAMTPGFKLWYGACVDCLAKARLRNTLASARLPPARPSPWLDASARHPSA